MSTNNLHVSWGDPYTPFVYDIEKVDNVLPQHPDLCLIKEHVLVHRDALDTTRIPDATKLNGYNSRYGPYYLIHQTAAEDANFPIKKYERWYMPIPPIISKGGSEPWERPGISVTYGDVYEILNDAKALSNWRFFADQLDGEGNRIQPSIDTVLQTFRRVARATGTKRTRTKTVWEFFIPSVSQIGSKKILTDSDIPVIPQFIVTEGDQETNVVTGTSQPNLIEYGEMIADGKWLAMEDSETGSFTILNETTNGLLYRKTVYVQAC